MVGRKNDFIQIFYMQFWLLHHILPFFWLYLLRFHNKMFRVGGNKSHIYIQNVFLFGLISDCQETTSPSLPAMPKMPWLTWQEGPVRGWPWRSTGQRRREKSYSAYFVMLKKTIPWWALLLLWVSAKSNYSQGCWQKTLFVYNLSLSLLKFSSWQIVNPS